MTRKYRTHRNGVRSITHYTHHDYTIIPDHVWFRVYRDTREEGPVELKLERGLIPHLKVARALIEEDLARRETALASA